MIHHLARRIILAYAALIGFACTVTWHALHPYVACVLFGLCVGPLAIVALRRPNPSSPVYVAPLPRSVALPTRWRDARWKTRDVRYAPED